VKPTSYQISATQEGRRVRVICPNKNGQWMLLIPGQKEGGGGSTIKTHLNICRPLVMSSYNYARKKLIWLSLIRYFYPEAT
jgi:hypothetical protein